MYGARISGDLQMDQAQLLFAGTQDGPPALSLNEAEIKGIVYLTGLLCNGPVSILFARMGALFASHATLKSVSG